ncbi:MAG: photosystem II stability/assembly factor-like uncharacterized protein [Spirosomataceae bacterium]|jgi:photosystem II stability/assembly factor-like uncharacterized protein
MKIYCSDFCGKLIPKITSILLIFLLFSMSACAQKSTPTTVSNSSDSFDLALLKNKKARSIGPATMSGRVTSIDAVWDNPDIIYVGTASGGVWKSENGGTTFTSVFDDNPIINIGAVAIQQSNPSVVWVGTGEGNPRNTVSLGLGGGIFKSMDGGKTWKNMGLGKSSNIHRIIVDPNNPDVVYVGVIGNPFADHPERGVYKTTDGGETWKNILFTNQRSGVGDMIMDPSNPNKIFVNMWEHHRTPYDFKSGGPGSGMYVTYDAGKTFTKLDEKNGLPKGDYGRMGFAIANSDPNIVYALVESKKNALYKSEDGGMNWKKINDDEDVANNRPFYFQDIAVDPMNENRLYNVYQMISMSEDGGKTFKVIVPYSGVHPDHHAFWIHPKDPSFIINGNDGGIAISRDRGRKWQFAESIPVGQYYHINVDNDVPYNVYGGLQDNGSWKGPAYTWMTGGIRNQYFEVVLFGDGFDVSPDPDDSRYGYAMSQGGNLARYDAETGKTEFIKPVHPDKDFRIRYNWNAAVAQDPHDNSSLYFGSQFVHKSTDKGMNWEIISPDLTTDNKEQQKASDNSGGLTIDITSAEFHNAILCIAPSPVDKNVVWAGTDDGNVQVTKDGGKTWNEVSGRMSGLPDEAWIPQIRASDYNAGEAFVVANNYRNDGQFTPYLYRTTDYGVTWNRVIKDGDVNGYVLSVIQDPVEPNLVFVGTEQGLYVSFDNAVTFQRWKHGFPPVSTMDLTIQKREADLVAATFGRAIFVLDDIRPLRAIAATKGKGFDGNLKAFASSDAYQAEIKDAPGIMFGADGMYEGENRPTGGRISFFARPEVKDFDSAQPDGEDKEGKEQKEAEAVMSVRAESRTATKEETAKGVKKKATSAGKKLVKMENKTMAAEETLSDKTDSTKKKMASDTLTAKIYAMNGDLIRTLQQKVDTVGVHTLRWRLDEKGVRFPGRSKPKKGDDEPSGLDVMPGTYKVVLHFRDEMDSTMIEVKSDPRLPFNTTDVNEKRKLTKQLYGSIEKLTAAVDGLDDAKNSTDMILSQIKGIVDPMKDNPLLDSLKKTTTSMQDSIKTVREMILGKKMEKQGYGRAYELTPQGKVFEAYRYIQSKPRVTAAERNLLKDAETLTEEAVTKVNEFFATQWADYRKKVAAAPLSMFKEYETIK